MGCWGNKRAKHIASASHQCRDLQHAGCMWDRIRTNVVAPLGCAAWPRVRRSGPSGAWSGCGYGGWVSQRKVRSIMTGGLRFPGVAAIVAQAPRYGWAPASSLQGHAASRQDWLPQQQEDALPYARRLPQVPRKQRQGARASAHAQQEVRRRCVPFPTRVARACGNCFIIATSWVTVVCTGVSVTLSCILAILSCSRPGRSRHLDRLPGIMLCLSKQRVGRAGSGCVSFGFIAAVS